MSQGPSKGVQVAADDQNWKSRIWLQWFLSKISKFIVLAHLIVFSRTKSAVLIWLHQRLRHVPMIDIFPATIERTNGNHHPAINFKIEVIGVVNSSRLWHIFSEIKAYDEISAVLIIWLLKHSLFLDYWAGLATSRKRTHRQKSFAESRVPDPILHSPDLFLLPFD